MKLITWNCQGAFRKKAVFLLKYKPDIVVIQECEHPDKLLFSSSRSKPKDVVWFGDNLHKGLGIFSYSDYSFSLHESYNPDFKYVIPISVTNGTHEFLLLAIWANNPLERKTRYVEQVWKAIHHYELLLDRSEVILAGDFNSNTIWDREHRIGNHSDVVEKLAGKKIHSVYHKTLDQLHGEEKHPTFFLHRNKSKPYHLDYCFVSSGMHDRLSHFELGTFRKWSKHSDHLPLFVSFHPQP